MAHISVTPPHRRYNALDALDKLVARECEAIQVRTGPTVQEPVLPGEDTAFVEGAVAYLAERPNAAELMSTIDQRWKALKSTADGAPVDPADREPPHTGLDESDGEPDGKPDAEPQPDASPATGPEHAP